MRRVSFKQVSFSAMLIPLAVMLVYPLAWIQPVTAQNLFQFMTWFTPAAMVLAALLLCLIRLPLLLENLSSARWLLFAAGAVTLVAAGHFLFDSRQGLEDLGIGLLRGTVPLAFYLYAKELRRMLPGVMGLFWLACMLTTAAEYFHGAEAFFGMPGNYNWNATLIAVSAPFVIYMLRLRLRKSSFAIRFPALLIPALMSLSVICLCHSRGAWLAIGAGAVVCVVMVRRYVRRMLFAAALPAALAAAAALMLYPELAGKIFCGGVRSFLWEGWLALLRDYWLVGTSPAGFENVFSAFIPAEYYLHPYAAARNNHPHNEFMYLIAAYGIPAGLAFIAAIIYPLFRQIASSSRFHFSRNQLVIFAVTALLTHGMFDLVLFEWPTNYLFFWLLALLWRRTWPLRYPPATTAVFSPLPPRFMRVAAILTVAAGLTALLFYNAYASFFSWYGFSSVIRKDHVGAGVCFERSVALRPEPYLLYRAAIEAERHLGSPRLALTYYRRLAASANSNFADTNGRLGQLLLREGRLRESLPFLEREVMLFPLHISARYYLAQAQSRLGMFQESLLSRRRMAEIFAIKDIDPRLLPLILSRPHLDLKWHQLNQVEIMERRPEP